MMHYRIFPSIFKHHHSRMVAAATMPGDRFRPRRAGAIGGGEPFRFSMADYATIICVLLYHVSSVASYPTIYTVEC